MSSNRTAVTPSSGDRFNIPLVATPISERSSGSRGRSSFSVSASSRSGYATGQRRPSGSHSGGRVRDWEVPNQPRRKAQRTSFAGSSCGRVGSGSCSSNRRGVGGADQTPGRSSSRRTPGSNGRATPHRNAGVASVDRTFTVAVVELRSGMGVGLAALSSHKPKLILGQFCDNKVSGLITAADGRCVVPAAFRLN